MKTISPYLTIKSEKNLEICSRILQKYVEFHSPSLFATGETSAGDPAEAFTAFTPGDPGHPQRSASYASLYVAKKYHDELMIIKHHENHWDQWMGTSRIGYLSWVLSFNL